MAVHYRHAMIVQDADGDFLAQGSDGDVCFVREINKAGRFYDLEVATDSAEMHCTGPYTVFPFYVRVSDEVH